MKLRYSSMLRFFIILFITIIAFRLLDHISLGYLFLIGLVSTVVICVIIGDGFLLPRFGNNITSILEGILSFIFVFIIDLFSDIFNTELINYVVFTMLLILFEYLFHRYLFSKEKLVD